MDHFRVYLPSNASTKLFPNNKPADYEVKMNPPIDISDGQWEVGVENVCYNSAIANLNEIERITLMPTVYKMVSINEVKDYYTYELTKEGKWNYDWIQIEPDYPGKFKYYGDGGGHLYNMYKIMKTLNSGNTQIMKDEWGSVYKFYRSSWRQIPFYAFKTYSSGFAMRLDDDLMQHLGFGHSEHLFVNGLGNVAKVDKSGKIKKSNYRFKIFDANIVACEERIILKKKDEKALSLTAFVKRWNETVGKKYGEKADEENGKLILNKKNDKLTVFFSSSARGNVRFYSPIIGSGKFWGTHPYSTTQEDDKDEWYVDIYGDRIKTVPQEAKEVKSVIDVPVRKYPTVHDVIRKVNPHMELILKSILKGKYNEKQYRISFTIENQRTVLRLGSAMKVHLSNYFAKLFGFPEETFTDPVTVSLESPMTLDKREQHLYIQSDLISPVSFGDKKEYILRDFIHDKDGSYGILEKLFSPILYHPVVKSNISTISMRITNGLRESIHLRDTKTLITLIFRRVK